MIQPFGTLIDCLFFHKNINTRESFLRYYTLLLVEIKKFNVLSNNKPFFEQPVTTHKKEAYEKLTEMSKNDDYTTGNLLDYLYHHNYCCWKAAKHYSELFFKFILSE